MLSQLREPLCVEKWWEYVSTLKSNPSTKWLGGVGWGVVSLREKSVLWVVVGVVQRVSEISTVCLMEDSDAEKSTLQTRVLDHGVRLGSCVTMD